jgi:hypothetical protein
MVVVVTQVVHAARRSAEADVRADERDLGVAVGAVDQPLRAPAGDVGDLERREVEPVAAREVDVHVEAVLVRAVARAPELRPERAAARPGQVADHEPRAPAGAVVGCDALGDPDQLGGAVAPPGPVQRAPERVVPGRVVDGGHRELLAADEAAVPGAATRLRLAARRLGGGEHRGGEGDGRELHPHT